MTATAELLPARDVHRDEGSDRTATFGYITPNWFAAVMGTAIVSVATSSLPERFAGLRVFGETMWGLALALLVLAVAATLIHWTRYPSVARGHHLDPVMAHFYGAPPMALLATGAATLLVGDDVIGIHTAVTLDWVLWFAGTLTGLLCAAAVPYVQFTRHGVSPADAFGGWLMPVVPPMVSASTGALLIPHAPAGQARLTLLAGCYAMFGSALLASVIVIGMIWYRLAVHGTGAARMVPTLWIVLGPLGQSITAANLLGAAAATVLPNPYGRAFSALGLLYGLPAWGFALLWACLAGAITVRTVRTGMPFALTWWSFTFPVGTCVTGTSALALHSGSVLFRFAAVAFFAGLVLAWAVVAVRTAHGVWTRRLLRPA